MRRPVGTPDSVQVLAVLADGARATYHFSGATPVGARTDITLFGSEGILHYDLLGDRIRGASRKQGDKEIGDIPVPKEKERGWRVEAEFVDAIRTGSPIQFTDFATGVAYMEFTEAVALSAEREEPIDLPIRSVAEPEA